MSESVSLADILRARGYVNDEGNTHQQSETNNNRTYSPERVVPNESGELNSELYNSLGVEDMSAEGIYNFIKENPIEILNNGGYSLPDHYYSEWMTLQKKEDLQNKKEMVIGGWGRREGNNTENVTATQPTRKITILN